METFEAIATRKSTRSFDAGRQIPGADLDKIVAAGCAAPVGGADYQSLHLTVIRGKAALDKFDRDIQDALHTDQHLLYGATAFVVISASAEQKSPNIQFANAGCIVENMLLAAAALHIDSVYIWGATVGASGNAALWAELGIPDGFTPVSGAAFGYATEPNSTKRELTVSLSVNYV